jgi:nucleoid-associated protein YgaU
MGILSSLGNAVEKAEEMLGFDKKEETVTAEAGAEVDVAQLQEVAAAEAAPAATAQTYTVQAGDTLSKISQHYFGNSHSYMKIFEANRDKLSDPDKIQVGQELTIPAE